MFCCRYLSGVWAFTLEYSRVWVVEMWPDHELSSIFEDLAELVVGMILDSGKALDSNFVLGIVQLKWGLVEESLGVE